MLVRKGGREDSIRNHVGNEVSTCRCGVTLLDTDATLLRSIFCFERSARLSDTISYQCRSMESIYLVSKAIGVLLSNRDGHEVKLPTNEEHGSQHDGEIENERSVVDKQFCDDIFKY